jgi:protein TonB
MRMTRLFKMRPQTKDGAPVEGGTVRIPLSFRLPKD